MSDLFIAGKFNLHSGEKTNWKIECDNLSDAEISVIARIMVEEMLPSFTRVLGVPRGGLRLAEALRPYCRSGWEVGDGGLLIVDDVCTTGGSLEEARRKAQVDFAWKEREISGAVIFARGETPSWCQALFRFAGRRDGSD